MNVPSLKVLHQNLYQLKSSRLMGNQTFRTLYDEAKDHEKQANLTGLITRRKDEKLIQDTNFYLILTKMLAELNEIDENDANLKSSLSKVYKWYSQNRQQKASEIYLQSLKQKSKQTTEENPQKNDPPLNLNLKSALNTFRSNCDVGKLSTSRSIQMMSEQNRTASENTQSRTTRCISPIYFPSINTSITTPRNSVHEDQFKSTSFRAANQKYQKYFPNSARPKSLNKKNSETTKTSLPDLPPTKSGPTAIINETKESKCASAIINLKAPVNIENEEQLKNIDDNSREEIIKALSLYADQLYSKLDHKDTKLLESHLKSLSKFYYTLSDAEASESLKRRESQTSRIASNITVNNLVEMAKEVSDKMVVSKAQSKIRISENQKLIQSYQFLKQLTPSNTPLPKLENEKVIVNIDEVKKLEEIAEPPEERKLIDTSVNLPTYSVLLKGSDKRARSASFNDWRGQLSMPTNTTHKLRVNASPILMKTRPKTSLTLVTNQYDIEQESRILLKNNKEKSNVAVMGSDSDEEKPRRRTRPLSKTKSKSNLSENGLDQTEAKETQYMSFVKRLSNADASSATNYSNEIEVHVREKSADSIKFEESQLLMQVRKPSRIKSSRSCRHEEEILCECHSYNKPSIEKIDNTLKSLKNLDRPQTEDIFHLTSTNEETTKTGHAESKPVQAAESELGTDNKELQLTQLTTPRDLKKILLENYDPQYANRIGIRDFEPTSVKSLGSLEFIPFEQIEDNYPKIQGLPIFDPNYKKSQRKLYRTNPSIPRPESKYGSKSETYEKQIEIKQQNIDSNIVEVWRPDKVLVVRDILDLEAEPLEEVLKVEPYKNESGKTRPTYNVNTNITAMGRPINNNPQHPRWKHFGPLMDNKEFSLQQQAQLKDPSIISEIDPDEMTFEEKTYLKKSYADFHLMGSSYHGPKDITDFLNIGRPIPTEGQVENPEKLEQAQAKMTEIKKQVHIPTLFKGTTVKNYAKEFSAEERLKRELRQMAAIKIQRNYRQHLRDKRFIENRSPIRNDMTEWAREHRLEMSKRKLDKENELALQKSKLEKENEKLKNLLKRIGIHVDLYKILYDKGPEYTNKTLNRAATCIQKWVRGWLVRKEFTKLKEMLAKQGQSWEKFVKYYRRTAKRIQKIRGETRLPYEFKIKEAQDFVHKEKKYVTFFEKLSYAGSMDVTDLEKIFHYCDLFPSSEELREAKQQVLKYHKAKTNTVSFDKTMVLDIIYYIYPPLNSKLKSTRKSTWMNSRVDNEDSLRLKGFKLIEETNFETAWNLVTQAAIEERSREVKKNPTPTDGFNN